MKTKIKVINRKRKRTKVSKKNKISEKSLLKLQKVINKKRLK